MPNPFDPNSWSPAGEDQISNWRYNTTEYDWKGRPTRTLPAGAPSNGDTLYTYEGCGCSGGQVTTIKGPVTTAVDVAGQTQTTKRRTQKTFEDILGRVNKVETWDLDGAGAAPYSTVKKLFNGRDQVTLIRQYQGAETSSVYQETIATFDGHGRLATSHRPEQTGSSVYNYNADDSIQKMTDARGVETVYSYETVNGTLKRPLITKVEWNVPQGSGITDPADVTYEYDSIGNRTLMDDGLGWVTYQYNSLSQMNAETRHFDEYLSGSPGGSGNYTINYSYELNGQLKSYTDPWGNQITTAYDKSGRLSGVSGTPFGGVTSYASNPSYRAWGGLKHLQYGSDSQIDITYDSRLQPATSRLSQISNPSNRTFDTTYEYYPDGLLKLSDESALTALNKFDRSFTYDFAGRTITAKSGVEAHGGTETDLTQLPYRQTYSHDAFGNLTGRTSTLWDYNQGNWNFTYSVSNNRVSGFTYDPDGRQTIDPRVDYDGDATYFQYDAAGRMEKTWRYYNAFETMMYQDGDGREVKRSQRTWDTQTNNWSDWDHVYFVNSTVLGRTISETTKTGKKRYTYVVAGGTTVARQELSATYVETVTWQFTDASGFSSRGFNNEELDGLGNNVGWQPFLGSSRTENSMTTGQSLTHNNMGMGDCSMNGIFGPCSLRGAAFATDPHLPFEIGTTVLPVNRDNLWNLTRLAEAGQGTWIDRDDPSHWGGVTTEFWLNRADDIWASTAPDRKKIGPVDLDKLRSKMDEFLTSKCKTFINELLNGAGELYKSNWAIADLKAKRDMQMPPDRIFADMATLFDTVAIAPQGGFYGSGSANISSASGEIGTGNATVNLAIFIDFKKYDAINTAMGLSAKDRSKAYENYIGQQAITVIHELIHFSFTDVELARYVAVRNRDPGAGFSYSDVMAASRYWNKELIKHCGSIAPK